MATDRPARPISPHLIACSLADYHDGLDHPSHHRRRHGAGRYAVARLVARCPGRRPGELRTFFWFFGTWAKGALGYVVGVGLTFSLFQHIAGGIRHFVMDTGAGYELKGNRTVAWMTLIGSSTATILFWAYLLGGK